MRVTRVRRAPRPVRSWILLLPACLAAWLPGAAPAFAQYGAADPIEGSVRQLQKAAVSDQAGSNLPRIVALRQLRDPALAPFFRALLATESDPVRVHAMLGLAELAAPNRLDPALALRLGDRAQQVLLASAIDMDLLDPAGCDELLAVDTLGPMPRALLSGEAMLAGRTPPIEPLRSVAEGEFDVASDLAAILLAQLGEPAAFEALRSALTTGPDALRVARTEWLLEAARQYRITAAAAWARSLAHDDRHRGIRDGAVFTLLTLAPEDGLIAWRTALDSSPRYRDRVQAALTLLATDGIPASAFGAIPGEEPIVAALRAAGRTLAIGGPPAAALNAVIDCGHSASTDWVIRTLEELDVDDAAAVLEHLVDRGTIPGPRAAARMTRAIDAVTDLHALAPDRVFARLRAAEDDTPEQEILLLGLYDVRDPRVGAAAAQVRRIGEGRTDSLALLLMARYATSNGALEETDRNRLARIATGGASLSPALQTQAAWLVLRMNGRTDDAVASALP